MACRFRPGRVGRHYFTIEAWSDDFAALRRDIEIKQRAGVDLEIEETRILIEQVAAGADRPVEFVHSAILGRLASASREQALDIVLAPATRRHAASGGTAVPGAPRADHSA